MKLDQLVKEWLSEFKTSNDGYYGFYGKFFGNKTFYSKLASAIENKTEIESICHQIYNFAHMKNQRLNRMLLDFLPVVLETYLILSVTASKNIRDSDNSALLIRICLMSVYNLLKSKIGADDPDKESKSSSFFIPIFTDGSVFHSQVARPDLDFLNYSLTVSQPTSVVINDRQLVAGLVRIYNQFICESSEVSLNDYCSLSMRIASLASQPRLDVASETLNELLVGIHFIISKDVHTDYARSALTAIESRANYELMTSVMLAVTAMRNSLRSSGPVKPRADTVARENLIITNASFKPEKVAEDLEHLLVDLNQNNLSRSAAVRPDHHGAVELGEISVQLTRPPRTGKPVKNSASVKYDKAAAQQHNGDNRLLDGEARSFDFER